MGREGPVCSDLARRDLILGHLFASVICRKGIHSVGLEVKVNSHFTSMM